MNNKLKNNVSGFESFDFDDYFLSKVDAETNSEKINNLGNSGVSKIKENEDKSVDKKNNCFNLSVNFEDFDGSDFLDFKSMQGNQNKKSDSLNKAFIAGLSPIHGVSSSKKLRSSFSSTPLRKFHKQESVKIKEKQTETVSAKADICISESDDAKKWNKKDYNEKNSENAHQSLITISQAVKLVEEAKSAEEMKDESESLNQSFDLLTGEVVGDFGDLFADSFNLSKLESKEKKPKRLIVEESICGSTDSSVVESDPEIKSKPSAAQKLNFEEQKTNGFCKKKEKNLPDLEIICFDSDDDFGMLTQVSAQTVTKIESVEQSPSPILLKKKKLLKLLPSDSEHSDDNFTGNSKKGTCFNLVGSYSKRNSSSPELQRKRKKCKRNKIQGRHYIESEAEVSDEVDVSSDELEDEGEYEKSFVDEKSYLTQNENAEMTAKYLESVKSVLNFPGAFKIPKAKSFTPEHIYSQIPTDTNTDYEMDSFCVNDIDEEIKSDLSDLEIAEKILEMDRKKHKKKKLKKSKRIK